MIGAIILGLLAGFVAKALMPGKDPGGFFVTILLGLAGSLVGFFLFTELLGIGDDRHVRPRRPARGDHRHDDPAGHLPGRRGQRTTGPQDDRDAVRAVAPSRRVDAMCAARERPAFDLQSHSLHSDGELPAAQVVENAAAAGVELLALSDHDTVDGVDEALAAGAAPRRARRARHRDLGGRRASTRTCTCSATGSTTAARCWASACWTPAPTASGAPTPWPPGCASSASRSTRRRSRRARPPGKPVGRPHLAAAVLAHPANAERLAAEGHADVSVVHPRLPDPGQAGLRGAHAPDRGGGDRLDPRRRRRGGLGAPVLGHRGRASEVLAAIDRYRAAGLDGVEVFYTVAHRGADAAAGATAARSSGCSTHRLLRLPRPRPPALQPLSGTSTCTAASRTSGRSPHGTLAAPARGGDGLCVWLTGLSGSGKSTVGRLAAGAAARPRPPRGGARRRRRAPEPLRRPRLLARGPRHQRAPHRLGGRPALPQRRGRPSWPRCRPSARRATRRGRGWASASWRSTCAPRSRSASAAT